MHKDKDKKMRAITPTMKEKKIFSHLKKNSLESNKILKSLYLLKLKTILTDFQNLTYDFNKFIIIFLLKFPKSCIYYIYFYKGIKKCFTIPVELNGVDYF